MKKLLFILAIVLPALTLFYPSTGYSITIKKEEEIAKQFISQIKRHYRIIEEPEVTEYINEIGNKIVSAFPEQPFNYRFYVVRHDTYNAFAGPAGHIFIHSALFEALKNEDELAGILGHEIAHVSCRHISERFEKESKINLGTLAGIAASIFLSIYGDPATGTALLVGSLAGGTSASLAYSREDEMQADRMGLQYLNAAGFSGKGLIRALDVIRSRQWYGKQQIPGYMTTHPALEDRMAYISNWIDANEKGGSFTSENSFGFRLAHTIISAKYGNIAKAKKEFRKVLKKNEKSLLGNYGYGIALARSGKHSEAIGYLKKALEKKAFHTGILNTLGEEYFYTGDYKKAENVFAGVLTMDPGNFEASLYYSRSLIETGKLDEALEVIQKFALEDIGNIKAFYCMADIYSRQNRPADSYYYLGLYYSGIRDRKNAENQFRMALDKENDPAKKDKIKARLKKLSGKKPKKKKPGPEE